MAIYVIANGINVVERVAIVVGKRIRGEQQVSFSFEILWLCIYIFERISCILMIN